MRIFSDLHFHSKYSRGCSKNLNLENLVYYSQLKGLDLLITGDFTHPLWFKEIKEKLIEVNQGVFQLNPKISNKINHFNKDKNVYFLIGGELSSIFKRGNNVYRIHYLVILPNFEIAEKFNKKLSLYSNLASDGRPILGLDVLDVLKILLDIYQEPIFIPAHIWTPWFSLYGSMSGFDSIYEAFNDYLNYITAVETGLSSDPNMNWRLPELDNFSIVSFSDSHSPYPHRIGREATVFEIEHLTYKNIYQALKNPNEKNKILMTIEFFPEEGKYHYDGHRTCQIRFDPEESKANNYICPVCNKQLTIGVMSRIEKLAKRPKDFIDPKRPPFKKTPPLSEIIAQIENLTPESKKIEEIYKNIVSKFGNEFNILIGEFNKEEMKFYYPKLAKALEKIEKGEVVLEPGYDGVYGKVIIKLDEEIKEKRSLF